VSYSQSYNQSVSSRSRQQSQSSEAEGARGVKRGRGSDLLQVPAVITSRMKEVKEVQRKKVEPRAAGAERNSRLLVQYQY
jgi:hypothetical protein